MTPFTFHHLTTLGYITIHWVEEPEFKVVQINLPRPEITGSISTEDERIASLALRIGLSVKGKPVSFNFDMFDFDSCSEFQRKVLMAEYSIPLGKVSTYGRIAKHIGHPGARIWVHQLEWNPAPVTIISALFCRASPIKYSSLRALFPPKARPVRSSLFTKILGPLRSLVRLGRGCSGVGVTVRSILGRVFNLMIWM